MISHFDKLSHHFTCPNPQCGKVFEKTYRSLLYPNEVACPTCGATIDIRESKSAGEIGRMFDTCQQLDFVEEGEKKK
jgi:rubredoxin